MGNYEDPFPDNVPYIGLVWGTDRDPFEWVVGVFSNKKAGQEYREKYEALGDDTSIELHPVINPEQYYEETKEQLTPTEEDLAYQKRINKDEAIKAVKKAMELSEEGGFDFAKDILEPALVKK